MSQTPIKAVIFDVYKTILKVDSPPPDADERWQTLWESTLRTAPSMSLAQLDEAARVVIAREHASARQNGIAWPEIYWPSIVVEVLPELAPFSPAEIDRFLYRHAQLVRTVSLAPGAAETLNEFAKSRLIFGIASNSQPYTLHELVGALDSAGLTSGIFHPKLCFWSFEAGFGKPDPYVYRWLSARLLERGIAASETLMVGDRLDNDILPARAQGWQTWQLVQTATGEFPGGDWSALAQFLRSAAT